MGGYRLLVWFWRTTTVGQTPVSPSPRRSRAGLRSLRSLRPALLLEKEPPQFPHPRPPEDAQPPQGDTIYIPCPSDGKRRMRQTGGVWFILTSFAEERNRL